MKLSESNEELKFDPIVKKNELRYNSATIGKAKNKGKGKVSAIKLMAGLTVLVSLLVVNEKYNSAKEKLCKERGIVYEFDYSTGKEFTTQEEPTFGEIVDEMMSNDKEDVVDIEEESSLGM